MEQFLKTHDEIVDWLSFMEISRYEIDANLHVTVMDNVNISERGLKLLPVQFKEVFGNFYCSDNALINLKGSPICIHGSCRVDKNKLSSLENGPRMVKESYNCSHNPLLSLKGSPEKIGHDFLCTYGNLTSLEFGPKKIMGSFSCSNNKLKNLKYSPHVGEDYACYNNELETLEGIQEHIEGDFDGYQNKLKNLKGAPKIVKGWFQVHLNELVSLEGAPHTVFKFSCSHNQLTNLKGMPMNITEDFVCIGNKIQSLESITGKIGRDLLCYKNPLIDFPYEHLNVGQCILFEYDKENVKHMDLFEPLIERDNQLCVEITEFKYLMEQRQLHIQLNKDLSMKPEHRKHKI